MENNVQNIPYFKFLIEPQCGQKANEILEKVESGFIHYLKLNSEEWKSLITPKETHLFDYQSPLSRIKDIGKDEGEVSNIHSLENLSTIKNKGESYFSINDGLLVCFDSIIKFIPISYNSFCEVEVSEDNKTATAKFFPAVNGGKQLIVSDVINSVRSKEITVSLEKREIVKALDLLKSSNEIIENVIVAKGKEPKPGKDAWIEYLFDTNRKTGPIINEDGNIDFHNLNLIESVTENQKIAVFHPMVEGEVGYDLFSNKIIPQKTKGSKPPKGQNIYYREEEPTHALSKIDGYITLVGSDIIITDIYNIRGDVDFHTGNIICKGSLNVTGNVKSGFSLDLSENITIGGYVKDSKIKSGGNITIRGGFSGTGEGKITSGGDVSVRYIRNQIVYSHGDIVVEKEVVEAKLFAKGDIKSSSNKMLLIGGYTVAGGDVIVNSLGHEYKMETKVKAGYDFEITEQLKVYDNTFEVMQKDLALIKEQIETSLSGGSVGRLAKALLIKQQMMKKKYEILKGKRKELSDSIASASGSKVIVSGKIYPGVKIFIDGYKFKVTEVMSSKIFYVSTDEEGIVVVDK